MSPIKFKLGKQEKIFSYESNAEHDADIPFFCGMDAYGEFGLYDHDDYTGDVRDWSNYYSYVSEDDIEDLPLIRHSDLFKEMCKAVTRAGSFLIADCKGGDADVYLFPSIPKRAFVIGGWKYTPHVSGYYKNNNSGNLVRHCTCVMERV